MHYDWSASGSIIYTYVDSNPLSYIDPLGLEWIYEQHTGQMYYQPPSSAGGGPPAPVGEPGYSGNGLGLNNFEYVNASKLGPIPEGTYTIGKYQDNETSSHKILHDSMRLTPDRNNKMWKRGGFLIHRDNGKNNMSASEGCIIQGNKNREEIGESKDKTLKVIF